MSCVLQAFRSHRKLWNAYAKRHPGHPKSFRVAQAWPARKWGALAKAKYQHVKPTGPLNFGREAPAETSRTGASATGPTSRTPGSVACQTSQSGHGQNCSKSYRERDQIGSHMVVCTNFEPAVGVLMHCLGMLFGVYGHVCWDPEFGIVPQW